ncbi:hypothetical protein IHE45_14G094400 [Dioscorea alata]|uniref:Uncharacterized protein n=1 Tax=Dioscorea alata TaxID=55571 RepID=A0ACB7UTG2_DIOAL|nr:hypothetical protein IHE45_14G094400 [Dioscorea alata]
MKFLFQCPCCSCFCFMKTKPAKPKEKEAKDKKLLFHEKGREKEYKQDVLQTVNEN